MRKLTAEQSIFIDAVRGLSAVAVLVGHGLTMLPNPPEIGTRYPIQSYGVILFFVLSGFLIAYNCMSRDGYTFSEYFIDRFSRIFTAFIPAIILVALVDPLYKTMGEENSIRTFLANIFMLHHTPFDRFADWLPRFEPYGSARQFWTIAVEWWLYIFFGSLFFVGVANQKNRLFMLALAPVAILVVVFFTTRESVGLTWFAGAAAAMAFCLADKANLRRFALPATVFFCMTLVMRFYFLNPGTPFNFYDVNFMMLTVGCFFSFMILVAEIRPVAWLVSVTKSFWVWLSSISYALYLTHQTLHYLWHTKIGVTGWWSLFVLCFVSILLAWVFTLAFDRHHKKVGNYLKRLFGIPVRQQQHN